MGNGHMCAHLLCVGQSLCVHYIHISLWVCPCSSKFYVYVCIYCVLGGFIDMYAFVCGTNEMAAHNLLMEMETFLSVCFPFFSHLGRERQYTEHKQSRAEQKRRLGICFWQARPIHI